MNADLHVFYQMVVVSGLIIILYPKKIIWWLGSIILSVILSLWYFVPVFLYSGYVGRAGEYVGWHGGYGSYPNSWYHDIGFDSQIWDILIYLPVNIVYSIFYHLIISVDASLDAVWEYNIYLGVPGTVITIACFLLAIKEFKWSKKNMLYYRYIIGLVLVFILSLSVVYQTAFEILHLMVPTFPVVDGVPSRFMNYALFAFFLISVTKYTSLFVFFSTNVKKKVEWFFIVVTTAFLLEHSYKWSVKQTEQRFELPPRDYPYQLLNLPQDEVYISVVTGSYLISFILISLTIVLYIKLSRSGKRTRST